MWKALLPRRRVTASASSRASPQARLSSRCMSLSFLRVIQLCANIIAFAPLCQDIFSKIIHHICQRDRLSVPAPSPPAPGPACRRGYCGYVLSDRTVRIRVLMEMEQRILLYAFHRPVDIQKRDLRPAVCAMALPRLSPSFTSMMPRVSSAGTGSVG